MLGRGAFAFPDLARQIKVSVNGKTIPAMEWKEVQDLMVTHSHMAASSRHESFAVQRCKQWIKHLQRNYPEAIALFQQIRVTQSLDEILLLLRGSLPLASEVEFAKAPSTS